MGSKANTVKSKNVQSDTGKISSNLTAESKKSTSKGPKLTKEEPTKRQKKLSDDEIRQALIECEEKRRKRVSQYKNYK